MNESISPEFLNFYLEDNKRMPLYLQKHIRETPSLQEYLISYNETSPISKKIFGKSFENVLKSWQVLTDDDFKGEEDFTGELAKTRFFSKFYIFYLKYRIPILVFSYAVVIFFTLQWVFEFFTSK